MPVPDDMFYDQRRVSVALAAAARLPAIHSGREFDDGGLIAFGPNVPDNFRRAAGYVDLGGLVVLPDSFTIPNGDTILAAAARNRMPAVYPFRFFALAGGLISYGVDVPGLHRRCADYIDRIFRGAKAGDLPIQNPTKFELAVNLETTAAPGSAVPPTLLATAEEVIE